MEGNSVRPCHRQGEDHAVGKTEIGAQRLRSQAFAPDGRKPYRMPVLPQQPGQCSLAEISADQPEAMFLLYHLQDITFFPPILLSGRE